MSQSLNGLYSELEILNARHWGVDVPVHKNYDRQSRARLQDVYRIWTCIAWDSLSSWHGGGFDEFKSILTRWTDLIWSLCAEDLLTACKELGASLASGAFDSLDDFKHHHLAVYPFVGVFLTPIKGIGDDAVSRSNTWAFWRVRTFLLFPVRINLKSEDLKKEATEGFLERITRECPSSIPDLSDITREWFAGSDCRLDHWCHHGPGLVAELKKRSECTLLRKYTEFNTDSRTHYCGLPGNSGFLRRCSRMIAVPKDFSRYRAICAEPATLQWLQQGVSHYMGNSFHSSSLKTHIHLDDQSFNAELAKIGSVDGSFATIDLSDASDSIRWELVKSWFRTTPFLRYFYACRSTEVDVDGKTYPLPIFATMGSALTFPVECAVFAVVVESAFRRMNIHPSKRKYLVYGDDIVCPLVICDCVVETLGKCGFTVNNRKSFTSTFNLFRESCGGEFLSGDEVTPIRVPRNLHPISDWGKDPEAYASSIELANRFYQLFPISRLFIISQLWQAGVTPYFTTSPIDTSGIYSHEATNWRAPRRYNKDLQRNEVRCTCLSTHPLKRDVRGYEDLRYFECLRQARCRQDVEDESPMWGSVFDDEDGPNRPSSFDGSSAIRLIDGWLPE